MPITLTKAKIGDVRDILRLEDKVWGERGVSSKYDLGVLIRFGYLFVAKDGRRIIGAIMGMKTKNNEIYVNDWFVEHSYRGKGVGKKLYARLIKAANGQPIVTMLHPNSKESIKAHKEFGFKIIRKIKDPYGIGDNVHRFLVRKNRD